MELLYWTQKWKPEVKKGRATLPFWTIIQERNKLSYLNHCILTSISDGHFSLFIANVPPIFFNIHSPNLTGTRVFQDK